MKKKYSILQKLKQRGYFKISINARINRRYYYFIGVNSYFPNYKPKTIREFAQLALIVSGDFKHWENGNIDFSKFLHNRFSDK